MKEKLVKYMKRESIYWKKIVLLNSFFLIEFLDKKEFNVLNQFI